ncbi:unnamed protein product [Albugo candida]|uniref:Uncharacterized protein n=1 Tax=Albugo candida TaxID=65357 RepID=A0A024GF96_9STRA|nr:unnamed protein product [Albugo candida]|eukprot:CCI45367.1 unnamed protein product [Albugo candida]
MSFYCCHFHSILDPSHENCSNPTIHTRDNCKRFYEHPNWSSLQIHFDQYQTSMYHNVNEAQSRTSTTLACDSSQSCIPHTSMDSFLPSTVCTHSKSLTEYVFFRKAFSQGISENSVTRRRTRTAIANAILAIMLTNRNKMTRTLYILHSLVRDICCLGAIIMQLVFTFQPDLLMTFNYVAS